MPSEAEKLADKMEDRILAALSGRSKEPLYDVLKAALPYVEAIAALSQRATALPCLCDESRPNGRDLCPRHGSAVIVELRAFRAAVQVATGLRADFAVADPEIIGLVSDGKWAQDELPCGHATTCLDGDGECRWCADLARLRERVAELEREREDCARDHPPEPAYTAWCNAGKPDVARLRARLSAAERAIAWACGEQAGPDGTWFTPPSDAPKRYWWRRQLREYAALASAPKPGGAEG